MKQYFLVVVMLGILGLFSCRQKKQVAININNAEVLHENQDQLTQVIIYDFFTPPVAARIYTYTSLASFEAIRHLKPGTPSLTAKMHGFKTMPAPDSTKAYDFTLAASKAFFTVAHKVIFSVDSLKQYEDQLFESFKQKIANDTVYDRSIAYGEAIAKTILARAAEDNYTKSRGKAKFLGSHDPGKWYPTPPDYLDGVEWCWNEMKPLVLDSAAQFFPGPPPAFSTDTNSTFFKMVKTVYSTNKSLTTEQKTVAKFWDDNPFVLEHAGHMTFANKKITPGGHWMGINAIASKIKKDNEVLIARNYALTAACLFDAFISCWDAKYKYNYVRPVSVINEFIDKGWTSFLQTPPFPEYTSGHSTITGAAAVMLTKVYGTMAFEDTSDLRYIGMRRTFNSFLEAAQECSDSRFYGGIHYKYTVDVSAGYGRKIGEFIAAKLLDK